MPVSIAFLKELEGLDPKLRRVLVSMLEELERQREESVTKKEFNELKEIVRDLGKAVKELAEAQKRTEARVEELTKAQQRSEKRLTRLEKTVQELIEAQKRTEARVEELAKAQQKSEERLTRLEKTVQELAEAQKKTEMEIAKLVGRMDMLEERLEGISNSVGYGLENTSYKALPRLLRERYGLQVEDRLIRRYIPVGKKLIQVNIYGHAQKDSKRFLILGECKVRPSKKEIRRFEKYAKKIAKEEGIEPFLIFIAHDFLPEMEDFLKEEGIAHFWSYELEP